MTTITDFPEKVQELLTSVANALARECGFIQRQRQLTGAGFAQALILGSLLSPNATRREQQQHAVLAGQVISVQGLEQRVEQDSSVRFMQALLDAALQCVVTSEAGRAVLPMFKGVYLTDCTRLDGVGLGQKAGVRLELQHGQLKVALMDATAHDQTTTLLEDALPAGALHLADLGFFNLARFQQWSAQGVYWLTRYKVGTQLSQADGRRLDLGSLLAHRQDALHLPVQVGRAGLPAYLVAVPLPPADLAQHVAHRQAQARHKQQPLSPQHQALLGWSIYLTNLPDLSAPQALALARLRWQIELLFKLWKSHAQLLTSRSAHPIRQQVETLAKLIAVLISHWLLLVTGWEHDALSPLDALRLLRTFLPALWRALPDASAFTALLLDLRAALARLSPRSSRCRSPLAFQLWRAFDYALP